MKKITVLFFALMFLVVPAAAQRKYEPDHFVCNGKLLHASASELRAEGYQCAEFGVVSTQASVGEQCVSTSGLMVFRPREFRFDHLNWSSYNQYGGRGYGNSTPNFPGSMSFEVQSALTRLVPQQTWESYAQVFQKDAEVRKAVTAQKYESSNVIEMGYYNQPGSSIRYAGPFTKCPDIWDVDVTVTPEEIHDSADAGPSFKRTLTSIAMQYGGIYIFQKARNSEWEIVGLSVNTLGQLVGAYSDYKMETAIRFRVTVNWINSWNDRNFVFHGTTSKLFPILTARGFIFLDSAGMEMNWKGWGEAIAMAMREVRLEALPELKAAGPDIREAYTLAQIKDKIKRGEPVSEEVKKVVAQSDKIESFDEALTLDELNAKRAAEVMAKCEEMVRRGIRTEPCTKPENKQ